MKILFSPSETKTPNSPIQKPLKSALWHSDLFHYRLEAIHSYDKFLTTGTNEQLSQLFGLKDQTLIDALKNQPLLEAPLQKAILRYTGVAYDYLSYLTLPKDAQRFIQNNVIIFSNLLGPLLAGDAIPNYKLKQGENIDGFAPEKHYKATFSTALDTFLEQELIIDLRAGFYEKFYTVSVPYLTCKFLKNGKSVSHWAKAYRGLLLRALAIHQPNSEDAFLAIPFEGLHVKEIIHKKFKKEYVFDIID